MTKKVLVTEKLAQAGLDRLAEKGLQVDVKLKMSTDELIEAIPDYDALVVRSATHVTREVIAAASKLRIIGRAGVGVDNVDVEAATEAGIIVCNAPTSNIVSAAEQTMCLMLACARNTAQANASMHAGEWSRGKFCGSELYEKTLAIFGLGRIGGLVAERARAFGMHLVGYDPYCSPERAEQLGVALYDNMEELLPLADFITVHLPKTDETIGMFGPEQYAAMKDGVILVNVARGGIYNVDSLADFLAAGKIGAAGIDVFEDEPCTQSPLHEFPNAILTPHLGAYTYEAQRRAGVQIADYIAAGLEGSVVPTALNMASCLRSWTLWAPYVPGLRQMMGSMPAQLGSAQAPVAHCVRQGRSRRCHHPYGWHPSGPAFLQEPGNGGHARQRRGRRSSPRHPRGHRRARIRRCVLLFGDGGRRWPRDRLHAFRRGSARAPHLAARLQG